LSAIVARTRRRRDGGSVTFVGAGPGDPDLLTLRALKLLQSADVVLYDALVSEEILGCIRRGAQRFAVGKRAGTSCVQQGEINRMLVALCASGKHVIRLKGGDPAIFARLAEETAALREAGYDFDIVPGITAASAAAAGAGVSLTERGIARRVQFVTAHARRDEPLKLDWASLADSAATTVLYMAREAAGRISAELIARGLDAKTPVLLMTDASRKTQQHLTVTLGEIEKGMTVLPVSAPLIAIFGAAMAEVKEIAIPRQAAARGH
jgi:uroporphyrin-III C-methyltransferase